MNRRNFLAISGVAALPRASAAVEEDPAVFPLHKFFANPLKSTTIDLLQSGNRYFLRTRTSDGAEGLVLTKNMEDYIPILLRRVIPHFLGKDARDLENLVDEVYVVDSNYKMAGQAFWCPVAYVEQSLFDLMGKAARKRSAELMGG